MNRYLIILAVLLVAGIGAGGIFFLLRPDTTLPAGGEAPVVVFPSDSAPAFTPQDDRQQAAAKAAFNKEVAANNQDNIKLYDTAVVGAYALQVWVGDNTGGEALLKFDNAQGQWTVVDWGGGAWSIEGLVYFGVPQATAEALRAALPR